MRKKSKANLSPCASTVSGKLTQTKYPPWRNRERERGNRQSVQQEDTVLFIGEDLLQ